MRDAQTEQALGQVVTAAQDLNVLCDQLNERYGAVEDALQRAGIRIELWTIDSFQVHQDSYILGYISFEGRHRLVVRKARDSRDVQALLHTKREVRVRAAHYVPTLLNKLSAMLTEEVEAARRSLSNLPDMRGC